MSDEAVNNSTFRSLHHAGTGPGDFTPDGCSVQLYSRLPTNGEPEIIAAAAAPGASLLELGSGAGRMTRPLLEQGFRVTAVDESAGMLAQIEGAPTVRSPIEGLDLGARFDVVLLASFLVNTADDDLRGRLLGTCARHVAKDGCVLLQREGTWHVGLAAGEQWQRDGMTQRVAQAEPAADGVRRVRMEYAFEDAAWSQTFYAHHLAEPEFEDALARAGLAVDRYLTEDRTWVRAVPV